MALSLFVLSTTDPGDVGFQREPDDVIALTYLILAIAIGLVALKFWWVDHVWQAWVLAIDIAVFVALPSLIEPDHEGYRIASLTTATFILLSVAIRWDWRIAGIAAVVLNLMNWILIRTGPLFGAEAQASFTQAGGSEYIRSAYYFMLISLLIVWVGSRLPGMPRTNFRPRQSLDRETILEEALTFVLTATHAKRGMVCWQGERAVRCNLISAGISGGEDLCENWDFKELALEVTACLFDLESGTVLWVTPSDEIVARRKTWKPPLPLVEIGERRGAFLPITGASGSGVLILADFRVPSVDLLRYLAMFNAEVSVEIDRSRAREIDREEQLVGLRNELARNLHDSVLQTIAGVRYMLASLRDRRLPSEALETEIEWLDETLAAEGSQLRATIDRLRASPSTIAEEDVIKGLEDLIQSLSRQWRTDIKLASHGYKSPLSATMDFELQQIIREGVSNAVRHGHADSIVVSLSTDENQLQLVIADNGHGFPADGPSVMPRMISQRAADLGGSVSIKGSQQGASIVLTLPAEGKR